MYQRNEQEIMKNWQMHNKKPVVSVCCATYNHEPYIAEAIEGFLMQETNFSFEILIRDDCSADNTASIVRQYADKYPNLIKPIFEKENQFSKGVKPLPAILQRSMGKYIAVCEGDDYWIDSLKLQKQIDFLENNPEYSMCYHSYVIKKDNDLFNSNLDIQDTISFNDYVKEQTSIQTGTVVFRNKLKPLIPHKQMQKYTGSYFIFLRLAEIGYLKYMDDTMSVYRVHSGGIWSGKSQLEKVIMSLKNINAMISYLDDEGHTATPLGKAYMCKILSHFNYYLVRFDFKNAKIFYDLAIEKGFSLQTWNCFFDYYIDIVRKKFKVKYLFSYIRTKVRYIILDYIYTDENSIKVFWFRTTHNFGDAINPLFLNALTRKRVFWVNPNNYLNKNYLVIGSILEKANRYSIIWGSGFIAAESQCAESPLEICAVRGPKTRQKLLDSGIACPEVYGDPALLLPKIYSPKIKKKYKLGIVPHFVDRDNSWLDNLQNKKDIKLLNIQEPDPLKFVDDLLCCEQIASSSLHGIIIADAYNIPSIWIKFSDRVIGGDFKFLDYFMSVKRKDKEALFVKQDTSLEEMLNHFYDYKIEIDLDLLLDSCPLECAITGKNILDIDKKRKN